MILASDEVQLWYVLEDAISDAALAACSEVISDDERARCERYRQLGDRRRCLLARVLVRTLLSTHPGEVHPSEWRFATNRWGKPEVVHPMRPALRFNLSHTRGLVVCALAREREVGVDAELVDPGAHHMQVAEGHFSAAELAELRALPESQICDRFYAYWTLKEAYLKARGVGLAIPLDSFGFVLGDEDRLESDDHASWQFTRFAPTPRHRVAVAVARDRPDERVAVRLLDAHALFRP